MSILTEPHRRRTVATAAVASSALLLGGCSFWAPNTTVEPYAPSYGVQAELGDGDVLVRDVKVVSEGDGAPGVLSAGIANRGGEDTTLVIEVGGTTEEVDLPAGGAVLLGVPDPGPDVSETPELVTVVVDSVDPIAGDVLEVVVTEAASGSVTLNAPIYLPEGIFEDLVPPTDG